MHAPFVTTLIETHQGILSADYVCWVSDVLAAQHQVSITHTHWLAENEAVDLYHTAPANVVEKALREMIGEQKIDAMSQPTNGRQKKLLITDMDSTIIEQECIDELAAHVGLKEKVAAITERAMNGELDFKAALRERVGLLKGLPTSALEEVFTNAITFMPGAKELVSTMRANGAYTLLVSGGFTFFTSRVRMALGFHEDQSNTLGIEHHALTGLVVEPILDKEAKLKALNDVCAKLGITPAQAVAVGDGANDLPMLQAAGLGVAYHAKPRVQAEAPHRITHSNLCGVLYAQGYGGESFNAPAPVY